MHITLWGPRSFYGHSVDFFVSKWPVSQKWLTVEGNDWKIGILESGTLVTHIMIYGVYLTLYDSRSLGVIWGHLVHWS